MFDVIFWVLKYGEDQNRVREDKKVVKLIHGNPCIYHPSLIYGSYDGKYTKNSNFKNEPWN